MLRNEFTLAARGVVAHPRSKYETVARSCPVVASYRVFVPFYTKNSVSLFHHELSRVAVYSNFSPRYFITAEKLHSGVRYYFSTETFGFALNVRRKKRKKNNNNTVKSLYRAFGQTWTSAGSDSPVDVYEFHELERYNKTNLISTIQVFCIRINSIGGAVFYARVVTRCKCNAVKFKL